MGYYADLIKEKRNARDYDEINKLSKEIKQIVSELRRKYTHIRQTDDVNFLLDVLHDRGQQIPQSDKNKAEHAMQLDETRRRMSVAPRDWGNSKEEKDNASVQDRFRHKGCMITILKKGENQYTFTIEQNGREEGTNATYPTQDKAESEAKREVEANWNEKEEGYYAKLAEEKAERKNYKFTDKEISDYLKSNPSQAKQYVRKKTAGKAENITIHPETLTAELDENGKTHLFKFVSDESLGFILKYMGTK